jgi:hypothetical protein
LNYIVNILGRSGLLKRDIDYHVLRATMVLIFAWFGYDKWFESIIRSILSIITHGHGTRWVPPCEGFWFAGDLCLPTQARRCPIDQGPGLSQLVEQHPPL